MTALIHPAENPFLHGHEQAENVLLDAYHSGRMHHAWLITGPRGIGKATLAYRFARFLLSGNDQNTLEMSEEDPLFQRIKAGSIADLLVLDINEAEGKTEITVDEVRKTEHFLAHTAAESAWRVVLVDSADAMNRHAANALLKMLEEPPKQTVLLLVSHTPGRLLPTIRSRCRTLPLRPLAEEKVTQILASLVPDLAPSEAAFAVKMSEGSPGLAAEIYTSGGKKLYGQLIKSLDGFPTLNISSAHSFADGLVGKEKVRKWRMTTRMLGWLLAKTVEQGIHDSTDEELVEGERQLKQALLQQHSIDRLAELWEKVAHTASEGDHLNMDRKMTMLQMMHTLQQPA